LKKSTKKILLAHSSNDLYGASKVLIATIDALILNGYEVHVILPHNGPLNYNKTIKKVNLSIVNLGVFRKKYFNILGLLTRLFLIIKSILYIKNYIKKNKIDLVYINTSTIISPCISSFISNTPNIFHIHEIPTGSILYLKFLIKIMNNFSSKVIAVSNVVKEFWISHGLLESKMNVIYNGYDFDFGVKKIRNNNIVFTSISRIIPYKGHLFLIELFNDILKYRDDIVLQIVGDTLPSYQPYLNELKSKVKEYKIGNNILFLGFIPSIKIALQKSNFFIHAPIKPDPAPAVILEAIESRTPVIYTNKGGAREILDNGKNGLEIYPDSIQKSRKLILDYINKKDIQKNNIKNSINFISKNFNKKKYQTKLINLLSNF
tara:strand:+ start:9069 stop:10196 length:1128 start_codon:yes stop_codon:yes gene_type:complete